MSLESVTIPQSVTSIGEGAFAACPSLTEFKGKFASDDGKCLIVDGVFHAFASTELTEYTIPDNVTSIGYCAFYGCSNLKRINLPDSITSIENEAFKECLNLTDLNIPDGVTSIGEAAFFSCSSLPRITIPKSVVSIGKKAFLGCSNLISVYCLPATPPTGAEEMFVSGSTLLKIYVDTKSEGAYRSAPFWRNYTSYITGHDFS